MGARSELFGVCVLEVPEPPYGTLPWWTGQIRYGHLISWLNHHISRPWHSEGNPREHKSQTGQPSYLGLRPEHLSFHPLADYHVRTALPSGQSKASSELHSEMQRGPVQHQDNP